MRIFVYESMINVFMCICLAAIRNTLDLDSAKMATHLSHQLWIIATLYCMAYYIHCSESCNCFKMHQKRNMLQSV